MMSTMSVTALVKPEVPVKYVRTRWTCTVTPTRTAVEARIPIAPGPRKTARARVRSRVLASLGIVLLTGCAVGPDYRRPEVPTQSGWRGGTAPSQVSVLPGAWWEIFGDAGLQATMRQPLDANQDLKVAVARVVEARASVRASRSERYPSLAGHGGYTRTRLSENRATVPVPGLEPDQDDYVASFELGYEVDIWGRVRRTVEAARADAAVVESDREVVLLTLTADVAKNYFLLRAIDDERRVVQSTRSLREDAVRLLSTRYEAGLINDVDVTRARTESATVEADSHALDRRRAQIEHALGVLCGRPAGEFRLAPVPWNGEIPEVPAGLPSTLLERRPDIVAAEHGLEGATARIGIAKAAFFPTIKLTGSAGVASADLASIVDWPSRMASFGPSISVPVFTGGRNRANLEASRARYEQTLARYRGTILNAFREVEDALSNLSTLAAEAGAVSQALAAARDTAALADARYQKGLSSYLDVVDAQRAALHAERQAAQLRGQRALSTILLTQAVGGGWRDDLPEPRDPRGENP